MKPQAKKSIKLLYIYISMKPRNCILFFSILLAYLGGFSCTSTCSLHSSIVIVKFTR